MGRIGNLMKIMRNDLVLIFRDPTLRIFVILLIVLLLGVIFYLPVLVDDFPIMEPFVLYIMMGATVQASILFGFIYAMVLIDEKESGVAKVYGVIPLVKMGFLAFRLLLPFLACVLVTFGLLAFQSFYDLSIIAKLLISIVMAFVAPILILGVSTLSKNKMEGMTWFKVFQILVTLPLLAYLVPTYGILFGIFPTYWGFELLRESVEAGSLTLAAFVGVFYGILLTVFLMRQFVKRHYD